ncbi:metal ABC transporter substrate-binding protein [Microbacterium sp.]|uniref:metal ABC transporter substrate-binding protein n=1 Tax=Microbacterium sp. TaxID=51671 RepID=UPI0039E4D657
MNRTASAFALASVAVLALSGCASGTNDADGTGEGGADAGGDGIRVVASTNVYGDIAAQIGGDHVEVSSIIASLAQDPHEYEASASDQLTVKNAQLIIENGGGYDAFIETLRDASGSDADVVTAVEYSDDFPGSEAHDHDEDDADAETDETAEPHDDDTDEDEDEAEDTDAEHDETEHADEDGHEGHDHIEGFNEHVWYDPHTIQHVAEAIAEELIELDAANRADYEENLAAFQAELTGLEDSLAEIKAAHDGDKIFVTEPVPLYLAEAAGLVNVTPEAFSEAVEEGQDVPPATLLESLDLIEAGDIKVLFANAQTGGAETTQVIDAAEAAGTAVQEVTELVPDGDTYISWMQDNIAVLAGNLDR